MSGRVAIGVVLLLPGLAWADGGTVRASRHLGNHRVTVFTAPTPLRAGPVDVSVFVQDGRTGAAQTDWPIEVRARALAGPPRERAGPATPEAATNKLFRAVQLDLDRPGRWALTVAVAAPGGTESMDVELEVGEPATAWVNLTLWIGWPGVAVVLFAVHRRLAAREGSRSGFQPDRNRSG